MSSRPSHLSVAPGDGTVRRVPVAVAPSQVAPDRRAPRLRRHGRGRLLLLVVASVATGCGGKAAAPAASPVSAAVPVTIGTAVRKTVPVTVRAIGHVEPIASVEVRARIGGELTRVWFVEGQHVTAGGTLFTIDPRPYQTALREADARVARDEAEIEKARRDLARAGGLVRDRVISPAEHERTATALATLEAQLAADRAAVDSARLQLSYCTIAAPVSGRTGDLVVTRGNLVKANDNPLVSINQIRPIHVAFSVPASFLPAIQRRQAERLPVTVTSPGHGDATFTGTLSFVDNAVERSTSTVRLKATFPNEREALWPGQFVDVTLTLGEEPDRVVAPAAAVQTGQRGQYVYVVTANSTAELRPVEVARMDEREAVIAGGLDAGERVVLEGHLRVVPGGRVQAAGAAEVRR